MTTNEIRIYLETMLNKHSSGNTLSPQELNVLFKAHIYGFVRNQVMEYRRFVMQGTPMDETVFTALLIDSLQKQSSPTLAAGAFTLPTDMLMEGDMWGTYNSNYKKVEFVSSEEYSKRMSNHLSKPIAYFPVAYIVGTSCKVFPQNMTSLTLNYIANPTIPVFDYYTDANYNIQYLAASATHTLQAGEYGSLGQVAGVTVTSLTVELDIPTDLHQKFADYLLNKVAIRDRDVALYQANENEKSQQA